MRLVMFWIVCLGVSYAGVVQAAPRADVREKLRIAAQLDEKGDYENALVQLNEGLAIAPRDVGLLRLKGAVLFKLRDYAGALTAYQACLDAGATGQNRREAQNNISILRDAESTFLDITVTNGPAAVYLDLKTQGVFCSAAPSCRKPVLPGKYKVVAERSGFEWTGQVTVSAGNTEKLAVTLVEKPSLLTVRVAPPGARVMVDDTAYGAPTTVPAGVHRLVVSLAGHATARLEVAAREGKPVNLDVALIPLVPIRLEPAGARLLLDGKPAVIEEGGIAIPQGAQVLVVSASGYEDSRIEIPVERPADYTVTVALSPRPPQAPASPSPGIFTPRRKVAVALGGVALAGGAAGLVLGVKAQQRDDEARELCPELRCTQAATANELNSDARSFALQANIGYGVAAGAALAAAVLWFTGAPEARVAVTPRLGSTGAGAELSVRF